MNLSKQQWAFIFASFCLFLGLNSHFFWSLMYPISYKDEVLEASRYFEVDPYLIFAIAQTESNFKQDRLSHKGATGLMQLMPDTAEWANKESGLNKAPDQYINDPRANILIGTWYLSYLLEKYHGDMVQAAAAYNAGQGNVDRWLREGIWDGSEASLNQVPYIETRHYVKRVIFYYYRYLEVYADKLS